MIGEDAIRIGRNDQLGTRTRREEVDKEEVSREPGMTDGIPKCIIKERRGRNFGATK